jgi:alpha-tubulin suppressor-like RCC1 family protein
MLGAGNTSDTKTFLDVAGLTSGVQSLALGADHGCALMNDSSVRCWGHNGDGQLGNTTGIGLAAGQPTPSEVVGLTNVSALALGDAFSCALTGSTIKCWGKNQVGQLGGGGVARSSTPLAVGGL